ncbi:hypothetical protein QR680_014296 [Steinernema hermaphroditum]|uniref:Uncharacterized protein n=1 Tax=Steinernema hermaphroditum TaxID=289476 RepID=A0AA39M3N8_9BILA|nr:hypothetical protein QR680_014296 [Steinernema hermaphroditum]
MHRLSYSNARDDARPDANGPRIPGHLKSRISKYPRRGVAEQNRLGGLVSVNARVCPTAYVTDGDHVVPDTYTEPVRGTLGSRITKISQSGVTNGPISHSAEGHLNHYDQDDDALSVLYDHGRGYHTSQAVHHLPLPSAYHGFSSSTLGSTSTTSNNLQSRISRCPTSRSCERRPTRHDQEHAPFNATVHWSPVDSNANQVMRTLQDEDNDRCPYYIGDGNRLQIRERRVTIQLLDSLWKADGINTVWKESGLLKSTNGNMRGRHGQHMWDEYTRRYSTILRTNWPSTNSRTLIDELKWKMMQLENSHPIFCIGATSIPVFDFHGSANLKGMDVPRVLKFDNVDQIDVEKLTGGMLQFLDPTQFHRNKEYLLAEFNKKLSIPKKTEAMDRRLLQQIVDKGYVFRSFPRRQCANCSPGCTSDFEEFWGKHLFPPWIPFDKRTGFALTEDPGICPFVCRLCSTFHGMDSKKSCFDGDRTPLRNVRFVIDEMGEAEEPIHPVFSVDGFRSSLTKLVDLAKAYDNFSILVISSGHRLALQDLDKLCLEMNYDVAITGNLINRHQQYQRLREMLRQELAALESIVDDSWPPLACDSIRSLWNDYKRKVDEVERKVHELQYRLHMCAFGYRGDGAEVISSSYDKPDQRLDMPLKNKMLFVTEDFSGLNAEMLEAFDLILFDGVETQRKKELFKVAVWNVRKRIELRSRDPLYRDLGSKYFSPVPRVIVVYVSVIKPVIK